eukprot:6491055-Prorocentrum_lima.AAC.1
MASLKQPMPNLPPALRVTISHPVKVVVLVTLVVRVGVTPNTVVRQLVVLFFVAVSGTGFLC